MTHHKLTSFGKYMRFPDLFATTEKEVIKWAAQLVGYDTGCDGYITSGASTSMVMVMAEVKRIQNIRPEVYNR